MTNLASPLSFKVPRSLSETQEESVFWKNHMDWLFRSWQRGGGGDDLVDDASQSLNDLNAKLMIALSLVDRLSKRDRVVVTIESLTARPFETVICNNTSSIDITLEPNPKVKDVINIKRKNATVNVIGTIDGKTNKKINIKYYSMKLIYDGLEWSEV